MTERDPFKRFILPHMDYMHAVARTLLRDRSKSGDLVMRTLMKAREKFETNEVSEPVRPWLTDLMSTVREREFGGGDASLPRRGRMEIAIETGDGSADEDPVRTPLVSSDDLYEFDELRRVLLQLPARYRRLLVLEMAGELDVGEVADAAGVPPSAIRMRLARGKELLRSKLEDHSGGRTAESEKTRPREWT